MPFVYILKSNKINSWHYIGSCHDLDKRIKQHNKGSVKSTKSKRPLALIYSEQYNAYSDARKREYFLKSPEGYSEKRLIIKTHLPR